MIVENAERDLSVHNLRFSTRERKEDCWTINVAEGQVRGVYRGVGVRLQKVDHTFEIFLDSVLRGSVSQRSPITEGVGDDTLASSIKLSRRLRR
jgi:hypothetical protein